MKNDILSTRSGEIMDRMLTVLNKKKDTSLMEFFGKSTASVSNARNKKVPNSWVLEFSDKTGATMDWLLTGTGPMFTNPPSQPNEASTSHLPINAVPYTPEPSNVGPDRIPITRRVPLISWVQAGVWTEIVDNYQPGDGERLIPTTKNVSESAFALRVSGTSMEPNYLEGDVIVVDPGAEVQNGSYVVVRLNHDNEATFKKLHFDGDRIFLEPLNQRYQPMEITGRDYTVCGVVRQMVRDIE